MSDEFDSAADDAMNIGNDINPDLQTEAFIQTELAYANAHLEHCKKGKVRFEFVGIPQIGFDNRPVNPPF